MSRFTRLIRAITQASRGVVFAESRAWEIFDRGLASQSLGYNYSPLRVFRLDTFLEVMQILSLNCKITSVQDFKETRRQNVSFHYNWIILLMRYSRREVAQVRQLVESLSLYGEGWERGDWEDH